ncbi:PulJ/GspJ family protein [Frondihabitans cladoniiphilus]|uniref:Prepilin-type N-terminal cleavage/methylation domain-containing protein n=1 Tax=Frondihabitans cladoniiphilus TaxID=715785 RepID=A0ABP8VYH9_9MICO
MRALRSRIDRITLSGPRDRGVSLVELLIAMTIFGFLLAMTVGFFVSASRASSTNRTVDSTNRIATNGMDELTRVIRSATTNPVKGQLVNDPEFIASGTASTAGANGMTLYSAINLSSTAAQFVKVQFSFVGTNLVESTWQPIVSSDGYFTYATAATSTRILASPVVLPAAGGPQLFTYLDGTGATIALTSGSVPAANIGTIAAVQISLQIGASSGTSQSTLLTNSVGLPNINVARNPS